MNVKTHDAFQANFPYRDATYPRPGIIIGPVVNGRFSALPISSALDLYRGLPVHFKIEASEKDFPATGLERTSYCSSDQIRELSLAHLIRKRGRLEGDLLKRFLKWI